jgi:hypothetical protein
VPDMTVVGGNPAVPIRRRAHCHSEADLRTMNGFVGHRLRAHLAALLGMSRRSKTAKGG